MKARFNTEFKRDGIKAGDVRDVQRVEEAEAFGQKYRLVHIEGMAPIRIARLPNASDIVTLI